MKAANGGMELSATCALGLEELLLGELDDLGIEGRLARGAVEFEGEWRDVWRCNWWLRTANRVLVRLASWEAADEKSLVAGVERLVASQQLSWAGIGTAELFAPQRTIAIRATASRSRLRDTRWIALNVKDGIVDAQRRCFGRRSSVDRKSPDLPLRLWLRSDRATLFLDTSGEPLDRRGYRQSLVAAPLRENIAAACILASGWDGHGPVVDPMCGSGTLLAEAGLFALARPPGSLRQGWSFERLPGFDAAAFERVCTNSHAPRGERPSLRGSELHLFGVDRDGAAIGAAAANLRRAGFWGRTTLTKGDAFDFEPPAGPGLVVVNPPHGERIAESPQQWRRLGDLLKQRYRGWCAVVLAGGADRGKHIGLRPSFRLPVRNGPLDARILGFELF